MGFMDLTVCGSGQAADSAYNAVRVFAAQLEKEFEEPANSYNTPGPLNVAMIITEMCGHHFMFTGNDKMQALAKKCLAYLEKTPVYGEPTEAIRIGIEKFIKEGV